MKPIEQIALRMSTQRGTPDPDVKLECNELKHWLEGLPLLKPKSTVKQLTEAIHSTHQHELGSKQRLELLQEYRTTVLLHNPTLNQDALKRLSIKDDERVQLQSQTTMLYLTLADGYKIIIKNAFENQPSRQRKDILLPLYHAIEVLSLTLLHCYRSYLSAPQHLYQDINQLYLLAKHTQLLDRDVETGNLSLAATTIGDLYKQIMYLGCIDPYQLPSGVAEKLYERLSRFSRFIQLSSSNTSANAGKVFANDLTQDSPPRLISKLSSTHSNEMTLLINPTVMIEKIRKEISLLETEGSALSIKNEIELLQRLNAPSQEDPLRQSERIEKQRICKLTFGIDAINHFLNLGKQELEQVLDSNADSFGQHLLEPWTITNESETGLSLTYQQTTRYDVRVGEIIGLLSEESIEGKRNGRIAIIRWIRSGRNNHIHVGIKFVPGNLLPAMCRLSDGPNVNNTFPAIFISSQTQYGQPATLLTTKKVYQENRIMEVTIGEQPMRIKAGLLHDDSFSFDRFDFSSLNS